MKNKQKVFRKERERRSGHDENQRPTSKKLNSGRKWWRRTMTRTKIWLFYRKNIGIGAGRVAHHTKAEREEVIQSTPGSVSLQAAARCTKMIKRKVLKKQTRKAKEHLMKCSLEQGKKKVKRKPQDVKRTEQSGKRNCKGTVQKCALIRRSRKRFKNTI